MPRTKRKKKPNPRANPANLLQRMKKQQPKFTQQQIVAQERHTLELYAADETNAKALGIALLQLKHMFKGKGKGAFKKWWTVHKLSQHRVSYCMRLAEEKVAAAKIARARNPQRVAASEVKQTVGKFLKFCANERSMKTVDQLNAAMASLSYFIIGGVGRMRKWPMLPETDKKVMAAKDQFRRGLWALLNSAFVTVELDDLEKITNRGYDGYAKRKQEPQPRVWAKAAGAGA